MFMFLVSYEFTFDGHYLHSCSYKVFSTTAFTIYQSNPLDRFKMFAVIMLPLMECVLAVNGPCVSRLHSVLMLWHDTALTSDIKAKKENTLAGMEIHHLSMISNIQVTEQ